MVSIDRTYKCIITDRYTQAVPAHKRSVSLSQLENFSCESTPGRAGGFLLVRPAGRTHLGVRVPYTPGKGKC